MFQRFMLDGHQCILEDPTRLHYEPYELKVFRNLECEWPLFFAFQIINHIYAGERVSPILIEITPEIQVYCVFVKSWLPFIFLLLPHRICHYGIIIIITGVTHHHNSNGGRNFRRFGEMSGGGPKSFPEIFKDYKGQ